MVLPLYLLLGWRTRVSRASICLSWVKKPRPRTLEPIHSYFGNQPWESCIWDKLKTFLSLLFILILKIFYHRGTRKEIQCSMNLFVVKYVSVNTSKESQTLLLVFRSTISGFWVQGLVPFYPNNPCPAKLTTFTLSILAMMWRSLKLHVLVWDCAWWWNPTQFYFFCLQFVYSLF